MSEQTANRARSRARRLAVQAVYQHLLGEQPSPVVVKEFIETRNTGRMDTDYFRALVTTAADDRAALDALIDPLLDRPLVQLDPVEHAVLLLAFVELRDRPDTPYKVVIDEAVELAKLFGGEGGYKYINAVVDKAAKTLRRAER